MGWAQRAEIPLPAERPSGRMINLAETGAGVAERHGATVFQVAIAWGMARSPSIVQIPGTRSLVHLEQNMAAARLTLDEGDMALLGQR